MFYTPLLIGGKVPQSQSQLGLVLLGTVVEIKRAKKKINTLAEARRPNYISLIGLHPFEITSSWCCSISYCVRPFLRFYLHLLSILSLQNAVC